MELQALDAKASGDAGFGLTNYEKLKEDIDFLVAAQGGWLDLSDSGAASYVSADGPTGVFSIPADLTDVLSAGMRIKLTQTTVKYFIVTAVGAFSGGVTEITVYGGTDYTLANAEITDLCYAVVKAPVGFPLSPAKWTQELNDASDRQQANPTAGTWYNLGGLSLAVPIGAWHLSYTVMVQIQRSGGVSALVSLSTTNNGATDSDLTAGFGDNVASDRTDAITRGKTIAVAAKTTYYLNARTDASAATNLEFSGSSQGHTIIRAVCAYL